MRTPKGDTQNHTVQQNWRQKERRSERHHHWWKAVHLPSIFTLGSLTSTVTLRWPNSVPLPDEQRWSCTQFTLCHVLYFFLQCQQQMPSKLGMYFCLFVESITMLSTVSDWKWVCLIAVNLCNSENLQPAWTCHMQDPGKMLYEFSRGSEAPLVTGDNNPTFWEAAHLSLSLSLLYIRASLWMEDVETAGCSSIFYSV